MRRKHRAYGVGVVFAVVGALILSACLSISTPSLPTLTLGVPTSIKLDAEGAKGSTTWAAIGLPPGLEITPTGFIEGTPTQAGAFTVDATVTDSEGPKSFTKQYVLTVVDGTTTTSSTTTSTTTTTTPPVEPDRPKLFAGERLNAGQELRSDGFRLVMQGDGNLVLYRPDGSVSWATYTFSPGSFLGLQGDGNLVVYSASSVAQWSAGTADTGSHNFLSLQGDGNLVLYTPGNGPLWSTQGGRTGRSGISLGPGESLTSGAYIHSRWEDRLLIMQGDGSLAFYKAGGVLIWGYATGRPGSSVTMQGDGNLVIYSPQGQALWSSTTANRGASRLVPQDDDHLVIYGPSGATWSSRDGVIGAPNTSAPLADKALQYVDGPGSAACVDAVGNANPGNFNGGECKQFVNCISKMALGVTPAPGYASGFANAGFTQVSAADARRGDVIQVGEGVHTAIVLENRGSRKFWVVDSNFVAAYRVGTHEWTAPTTATYWRPPGQ